MGKIIISEFISLDGVMEGPGPDDSFNLAGWTMPYGNEQSMKFKFDEVMSTDALLLGRMTYDGFAKAWPNMKDEAGFADKMNDMPKYVVSRSLENVSWNNSHILKDTVIDKISDLKKQTDHQILVNGSASLVQMLFDHSLVDELRLLVYPVILGSGKRLFTDGIQNAKLELISSDSFETGVVLLKYRLAA